MFCRFCGKELPNDSLFCPNCGNKLVETAQENIDLVKCNNSRCSQLINEVQQQNEKLIPDYSERQTSLIENTIQKSVVKVCDTNNEKQIYKEKEGGSNVGVEEVYIDDSSDADKKIETMSLFRRFFGNIIDNISLVIIIFVYTVIFNYYGAGRIGTYLGLLTVSPNKYEYIDKNLMNNYGQYGKYSSKEYQDMAKLVNEPPHIGYVRDLDYHFTMWLIFLNLLYFLLFEWMIGASFGKVLQNGVIIDTRNYIKGKCTKINFGNVLFRTIVRGLLMFFYYIVFHLGMNLSNIIVFLLYILMVNFPLFYKRQTLLDLFTDTIYVKK